MKIGGYCHASRVKPLSSPASAHRILVVSGGRSALALWGGGADEPGPGRQSERTQELSAAQRVTGPVHRYSLDKKSSDLHRDRHRVGPPRQCRERDVASTPQETTRSWRRRWSAAQPGAHVTARSIAAAPGRARPSEVRAGETAPTRRKSTTAAAAGHGDRVPGHLLDVRQRARDCTARCARRRGGDTPARRSKIR